MHVVEVKSDELLSALTREVAERGIVDGAIVSLIGAVDAFTVSTMREDDASADVITTYSLPAELSGTGEIHDGSVHIHATLAVAGDRAISGHLHDATVGAWFVRAYIIENTVD